MIRFVAPAGVVFCAAVLLAISGGCIPSRPTASRALDRQWTLTADVSDEAPLARPDFGGIRLPGRWIIRQEPSIIYSTVSIVRAMDELEAGREEITFAVSPEYTSTISDMLDEIRLMLESLKELTEAAEDADRERWASTLADALVQVEQVARRAEPRSEAGSASADEGAGMPAEPILALLAMYLNEQTDRSLLEGLDPEEIHQVRTVMTQVALELGFAMGGKQPPEELREHVLVLMDESPSLAELKKSLAALLEEQIAVAPIGVQARRIQGMMDTLLTWSPKGLAMMQQFIDQWNKMREMQIELREENGRTIVSATLRVQPGQEVRLADVVTMQPRLVFRGESRITVLPDVPPAGISAFLFEPISEDGGVQLRFEGIAYGLVRLLAIPLADSTLREIRFFNGSVTRGNELVHVEMLMEATGRHDDPRRALIVHNTSRWRMIRRPFALEKRSLGSTTLFHYITPDRHYSYTYEGEPDEVEKPLTRQ